jgi:hypothetical protein
VLECYFLSFRQCRIFTINCYFCWNLPSDPGSIFTFDRSGFGRVFVFLLVIEILMMSQIVGCTVTDKLKSVREQIILKLILSL